MSGTRWAHGEGINVPVHDGLTEHALRYSDEPLSREDRMYVASMMNAYFALTEGFAARETCARARRVIRKFRQEAS